MAWLRDLAFDKTGSNIAAKMAMMAMTTSSSINVKPCRHPLESKTLRESVCLSFIISRYY